MEGLVSTLLSAGVGAIGGATVAGLIGFARRRVKITGPNAELNAAQQRQLNQLVPLVLMLVRNRKPELVALLGILDALKDKTNGKFKRAYAGVKKALDEYDKTMDDALKGALCEEPKR